MEIYNKEREMDDKTLRDNRLIFYKDDIEKINKLLEEFINVSGSKCAFLVDKSGHLITQEGIITSFNPETLSALIAGSFAATKEMARILGESEFSVLFHQGKKDHIHISLVSDRAILAIVFDETTTIGMVRLYTHETIDKLEKIFKVVSTKTRAANEIVREDFASTAKDELDSLFKE
ncbi:MAG: roadblock/LC7 domain-containing protein [Nitrospinae bacterium]|nr:roadblock/LC7 domain-containing protein [Nitrospinota bacterium]